MSRWANLLSKKPKRKNASEIIDHVEREINGEIVKVPLYSEGRQRKRSYMKVRATRGATTEGVEAYTNEETDEVVETKYSEVYVK